MANQSWDKLPAPPRLSGHPEKLREAIADLETIAERNFSPVARMIDLGRRFIAACFKKKNSEKTHEGTQERLISAIGVIKAHYLDGNNIRKKITKSVIEPKVRSHVSTPSSCKIASLRAPWRDVSMIVCQATPRELDLFRVKAISLIHKYVTQSNLLGEALEAIRNTPIVQAPLQEGGDSGTITLTQTIQLFPDCFVLQGSFHRNAHSAVTSIPLSGSFRVVNSIHPGHPRPKLHNGWALSEHLLPAFADVGLANPTLFNLLSKKQRIADELQMGGGMVNRAKQLIATKQFVFQGDLPKYLSLHQALATQIVTAGAATSPHLIQAYFSWLSSRSDAYEQLSQHYEILNEVFLGNVANETSYHEKQQQDWLAAQPDHPATHFIAYLGPILAKGRREPHTLFGRQMLRALYHQLWSFQKELYQEADADTVAARITDSLITGRLCFEKDPLDNITTIPQKAVVEHLGIYDVIS